MAKARKGSRRAGALRGVARSKIARSRGRGTVALHSKAGGIATFSRKGKGGGGYRGFKSKKQWRWAHGAATGLVHLGHCRAQALELAVLVAEAFRGHAGNSAHHHTSRGTSQSSACGAR